MASTFLRKFRKKDEAPPTPTIIDLRVFVNFTVPPQTVVITADYHWSIDAVRTMIIELLVRNGVANLTSLQPFDYTIRFENPAVDKVYIPKEAEKIKYPGLVMEKSAELLEREALLKAERDAIAEQGRQEMLRREIEEAEYRRRVREIAEAEERERQRQEAARLHKEAIEARRATAVAEIESRREETERAQKNRCALLDAQRLTQWHLDHDPPVIRQAKKYVPKRREPTKAEMIIAKIEQRIQQAADSHGALTLETERRSCVPCVRLHNLQPPHSLLAPPRVDSVNASQILPASPPGPQSGDADDATKTILEADKSATTVETSHENEREEEGSAESPVESLAPVSQD